MAAPLLDLARELYGEAVAMQNERLDMAAILRAIERRTGAVREDRQGEN